VANDLNRVRRALAITGQLLYRKSVF